MKSQSSPLTSKEKPPQDVRNIYENSQFHIALSHDAAAIKQYNMKDYKSAFQSFQHALQIRLKLCGENHRDIAQSNNNIGGTKLEMKDYKIALDTYKHALEIRLKLFGEDHPDTAKGYREIGVT